CLHDALPIYLVHIAHADKDGSAGCYTVVRTQLGLAVGFAEGIADTHDFTGRFHLWAEDRVNRREFVEGEYRYFHAVIIRDDLFGEALVCQRNTRLTTRRHLRQ